MPPFNRQSKFGYLPIARAINWQHPLARGIISFWRVTTVGGIIWRDLVRGAKQPHDGTLVNGASFVDAQSRLGGVGSLELVAASSQQVTQSYRLTASQWAVMAWVRPTTTSGYRTVYASNNAGVWLHNGKIDVFLGSDHDGTATLSTGVWYHIIVVGDDVAKTLTYYINGSLDRQYTGLSSAALLNEVQGIGGHGSEYFDGLMDEVIIFAGLAPSSQTAAAIYRLSRLGWPGFLNYLGVVEFPSPIQPPPVKGGFRAFWPRRQTVLGVGVYRKEGQRMSRRVREACREVRFDGGLEGGPSC